MLKDHFVAILKKCPNPDQYTISALLAGALKRVNALATVFTEARDIMHGRQRQAPKGRLSSSGRRKAAVGKGRSQDRGACLANHGAGGIRTVVRQAGLVNRRLERAHDP